MQKKYNIKIKEIKNEIYTNINNYGLLLYWL